MSWAGSSLCTSQGREERADLSCVRYVEERRVSSKSRLCLEQPALKLPKIRTTSLLSEHLVCVVLAGTTAQPGILPEPVK